MSSFLKSAACKGRQPEHVAAAHLVPRPDLVARLLRERHVARFLVAPDGFGKTQLAFQYAETVFAFFRVFWVNGKSPCFLRDLDNGEVSSYLCSQEERPFLVVFEDVPRLDDVRVDRFSRVIDDLLEAGNEVLATCAPSCDAYGSLHRDRLKLDSSDLLLSEAECEVATPMSRKPQAGKSLPPAERIACLRWGGDDGAELLAGLVREELPGTVLLVVFSMLVLREGEWADLDAFTSSGLRGDLPAGLEERYPYLGINRHGETYRTVDLPAKTLASAFDRSFDALASCSLFDGRAALACRLADALVVRREGERACRFMAGLSPKPSCASWLAARSRALMSLGCVKPAHDLHLFIGRVRGPQRWTLNAAEAWRLVALSDEKAAVGAIRRMAFSADVPAGPRASALMIVLMYGSVDAGMRAAEALRGLVRAAGEQAVREGGSAAGSASHGDVSWLFAAEIFLSLRDGLESGLRAWQDARRAECERDLLFATAAAVLDAAMRDAEAKGGNLARPTCARLLREVVQFVRTGLGESPAVPMSLFSAFAALAFERMCEAEVFPDVAPLPSEVAFEAHRVELSLFSQRSAYRHARAEEASREADFEATHPDAFRDERRTLGGQTGVACAPILHVDLFGGLSVRIGDDQLDPRLLRRQKSRTLLALLVMNRGKEMPRDRLVQTLWPESDLEAAKRNFYAVWSQLRRALTTGAGTCPYLVRAQSGFRLDARLLDSDLDRFEAMCRTLLFGHPRADEWELLFAQASGWYAEDLLPGESDCPAIDRAREDCRVRLVDALVSASAQLVGAGEVRGGLWFAREALKHDKSREDAYTTLMEAQIAAGQRTAALDTYFACRRYLADELGIDPSAHTVRLYRDIIEAEEAFDW